MDQEKPANGIKVIVVGLGLGGLTAAIECYRNGHDVVALEKNDEVRGVGGDCISITSNGARVVSQWGDGAVHEELVDRMCRATKVQAFNNRDELLNENDLWGYQKGTGYTTNRGELVTILFKHLQTLDVDIRLNSCVTECWETDEEAGVVIDEHLRLSADCVICSDGIHSMGRAVISREEPRVRASGFSGFSSRIDADEVAKDPQANWFLKNMDHSGGDKAQTWFGDGVQFMMMTLRGGLDIVWVFSYKDSVTTYDFSPATGVSVDNVVELIKDWPVRAKLEPILRKTPANAIYHRQHVFTSPLKTWVSPRRRMFLMGDAAHVVCSVVGQGGNQAIEDGAVAAIALKLAGKGNEPLALRVTEKIRHRAVTIQLGCLAPLEVVSNFKDKDPRLLSPPRQSWIFEHDCQKYVYQEFTKIAQAVQDGTEYIPRNLPDGGTYRLDYDYCGR
ncbi:FAD-dependent monooxygenase fmqB [Aspergillus candidus]|uniref:FAD/NAD(P)-binding domain-containing protein n=1 Tax=Aspergillus candidus TaxID=41067 RepID=A0A2I2FGX1_ASPCN|nr:FAD/NAD(P)-binding domain-containing protein [Aspergillus candidus]PLB39887.1 FAD/NAD(P)-binding domain-containing protein [Aspergillus candidus]